jgi:hypothetical protein
VAPQLCLISRLIAAVAPFLVANAVVGQRIAPWYRWIRPYDDQTGLGEMVVLGVSLGWACWCGLRLVATPPPRQWLHVLCGLLVIGAVVALGYGFVAEGIRCAAMLALRCD